MSDIFDFAYLSIILTIAACFGIIANKFKQPPLLGYIFAGIFINVINVFPEHNHASIELFSKIGIAFLLFILGMELDLRELKKLGKVVFITGIGQIVFTTAIGYLISQMQGFNSSNSIFIAIALTFSSTIIIVKLLTSQKELHSLHGKIAVGFLLVQDFAAILILIGLGSIGSAGAEANLLVNIFTIILKICLIIAILYLFSKYIIPWLIKQTGHDREVLFVSMSAMALFFGTLAALPIIGFSIEIGALCAGIALSSQKENLQIESWTRPLRDFFLTIFFVMLGLNIHIENVAAVLVPSIIFSLFVLIGNPLIVMILMSALGYEKRVSFYISLTVAQISEFSLLVGAMGVNMNFMDANGLTIITLVGGITMTVSTYMIYYKDFLYKKLKPYLNIFEFRKSGHKMRIATALKNHIIVFGYHRLGEDLSSIINENKSKFLIVDHDPLLLNKLNTMGFKVIYGDMFDTDIYDKLNMEQSSMVISTVPEYNANLTLIKYLKEISYAGVIINTAQSDQNAIDYYNQGSNYVIYPHLIAGQKLTKLVSTQLDNITGKNLDSLAAIERMASKQLPMLRKRLEALNPTNA
jgi:Kef-type K+ transport system membrane component KefB/Trk K+ transport system NAD-binding subunit